MNEKRMVLMGIIVGTLACLFGTESKAKADTLSLTSVTQVAVHQVEGKGTWSTNGTLVSITMYVNDPNNNNVSTTAGITTGQNWASISTAKGGLTVGAVHSLRSHENYGEWITDNDGQYSPGDHHRGQSLTEMGGKVTASRAFSLEARCSGKHRREPCHDALPSR